MTAAEAAQLDQVLQEGQSVVRVTILLADDTSSLIAAAISGKPEAKHLLRTIKDAIDHIEIAPPQCTAWYARATSHPLSTLRLSPCSKLHTMPHHGCHHLRHLRQLLPWRPNRTAGRRP